MRSAAGPSFPNRSCDQTGFKIPVLSVQKTEGHERGNRLMVKTQNNRPRANKTISFESRLRDK